MKPKVYLNHQEQPGKGKSGRVNANEPLMRLRDHRSPENRWLTKTAMTGHLPRGQGHPLGGHLDPGVEKAPSPLVSHWCGTW
jgi:hypothetical protein